MIFTEKNTPLKMAEPDEGVMDEESADKEEGVPAVEEKEEDEETAEGEV